MFWLCGCSLFGLNDSEVAEAQSNVEEAINENMGMAMVFSLIEVAKEWLKSKVCVLPFVDLVSAFHVFHWCVLCTYWDLCASAKSNCGFSTFSLICYSWGLFVLCCAL